MANGNSGNGNGISYETIRKNKTLMDFFNEPLQKFLLRKNAEFEKEKEKKV